MRLLMLVLLISVCGVRDAIAQGTLEVGDSILVRIDGHPELGGRFVVNEFGDLLLPQAGVIPARGGTTEEIARRVRETHAGYLGALKVTVSRILPPRAQQLKPEPRRAVRAIAAPPEETSARGDTAEPQAESVAADRVPSPSPPEPPPPHKPGAELPAKQREIAPTPQQHITADNVESSGAAAAPLPYSGTQPWAAVSQVRVSRDSAQILAAPEFGAAVVLVVDREVILPVLNVTGEWLDVMILGKRGYIHRDQVVDVEVGGTADGTVEASARAPQHSSEAAVGRVSGGARPANPLQGPPVQVSDEDAPEKSSSAEFAAERQIDPRTSAEAAVQPQAGTSVVEPDYSRSSIGVAILVPADGTVEFERLPSGRVTVERRFSSRLALHVGVIRMAPLDVSLWAGAAGLRIYVVNSRLRMFPFAEAGYGAFRAVIDAGGYHYLDAEGGEAYRPHRQLQTGSAAGYGVGIGVDFGISRRIVAEVVAGTWVFNAVPGTGVDGLYAGGGLRLAR